MPEGLGGHIDEHPDGNSDGGIGGKPDEQEDGNLDGNSDERADDTFSDVDRRQRSVRWENAVFGIGSGSERGSGAAGSQLTTEQASVVEVIGVLGKIAASSPTVRSGSRHSCFLRGSKGEVVLSRMGTRSERFVGCS
jgi:hypothetical protein